MNYNSHSTEDVEQQDVSPEKEKSFFGIIVHSFFIIPFLIAVFCLLLFAAVSLLTNEKQTVYDYINNIKTGGSTKRWQSAFELSKYLANPGMIPEDERFNNEMINVFESSKGDDARVRQYLALAMGRTQRAEFLPVLLTALDSSDDDTRYAIIFSLGMLRNAGAVSALVPYLNDNSARIRSVTAVALGTIGDKKAKDFLKNALNDSEPNVQWGSAISLALMKDAAGAEILAKLLDRSYLEKFPEVEPEEANQLILATIDASSNIQDREIQAAIQQLSTSDKNMKVRAAALEYLKQN